MRKICSKISVLVVLMLTVLCAEPITYTAKDKISLQGKANRNVKIEVFINERKVADSSTDDTGVWVAYDVPLELDARNEIYAIAVAANGTRSKTSTRLTVIVDTSVPQFLSVALTPTSVRPEESVKITVRTDKTATGVSATLPDSTELALKSGSGNTWTGEWRVPKSTSGGKHNIVLTAVNKLGTTNQTPAELLVDAEGSLTVTAPEDNTLVYEETIPVTGVALNSTQVEVGQDRTAVGADGSFTVNHRLARPGRNLLSIVATGLAGNRVEQKRNVVRLLTFPDIQSHWAKSEIEYLATLGYIQAYPNSGLYAPERNITRAELAALLVRARKLPESTDQSQRPFGDVQNNYWASGYIATAAKSGIVEGYPGRVYKPNNYVTRAEAAAMFSRYANAYSPPQDAYADVPAGHWAAPTILAFDNSGLTPPAWQNQQNFNPNQPITRAEVAAILARVKDINRDIELMLGFSPNLETYNASSYTPSSLPQSTASAPPVEVGTAIPVSDGYVYPEMYDAPPQTQEPVYTPIPAPAVQPSSPQPAYSPASGSDLTRAQAAALLAKHGYIRQAIVNVAPARDVPLYHPQVKAIKSAIVTGIMPNKSAGTFAPSDRVSVAEANNILRRAKISATISGSGYVSAAEFERRIAK